MNTDLEFSYNDDVSPPSSSGWEKRLADGMGVLRDFQSFDIFLYGYATWINIAKNVLSSWAWIMVHKMIEDNGCELKGTEIPKKSKAT